MSQADIPAPAGIDEPLAESAMLARDWAREHCVQAGYGQTGCAWYHGAWQALRLFGVFQSIRSDDEFILPALTSMLTEGVRRILISGAADYALLARVVAAAGARRGDLRVTVVDRCATPLKLNAWYGERAGIAVDVVQGDILEFDAPGAFDLVCTHSFICFFAPGDRQRLLQQWWACLAPGGRVLTAQRARTEDHLPVIRYSGHEVEQLAARAYQLAGTQGSMAGFSPELVRDLAIGYGANHWTYLVRTPQSIRDLFEDQGFELETFTSPGNHQKVVDRPGTPNQAGSVRWRVLARRPQP